MVAIVPAILSVFIVCLSTTAWTYCDFARVQVQTAGALNSGTDDFFGDLFSDATIDNTYTDIWSDSATNTDDFWDSSYSDFTSDFNDYYDTSATNDIWGRYLYGLFDDESIDITDSTSYRVGLFSREMMNFGDVLGYFFGSNSATASGCVGYSSQENQMHDALFKSAQSFGVLCGVMSFIMMVTILSVAPCVRIQRKGYCIMGIVLILMGICQSFTVVGVLFSNVCRVCAGVSQGCTSHCQMSTGSILAIVTSALWLISGMICCFCISSPQEKEDSTSVVYATTPVNVSVVAPMPEPVLQLKDKENASYPNENDLEVNYRPQHHNRNQGDLHASKTSHSSKESHSSSHHQHPYSREHRHRHQHTRSNKNTHSQQNRTIDSSDSISL